MREKLVERDLENNASGPRDQHHAKSPIAGEIDEILRIAEQALANTAATGAMDDLPAEPSPEFRPIVERFEKMSAIIDAGVRLGRSGNAWAPERLVEATYQVEPITAEQAIGAATQSRKLAFLNRLRSALRMLPRQKHVVGQPTLIYVPVWYAEGYHECYYLRSASYKVDIPSDVVAVEVEGKTRDLHVGHQGRKLIPEALARRLQSLGSIFLNQSKYIYVDNIVELARSRTGGSLYESGDGRNGELLEELIDSDWKLRRIFDQRELAVEGAVEGAARVKETRGRMLSRFREMYLALPPNYREILSNKFEITTFSLYCLPYYKVKVKDGSKTQNVVVHGVTGDKAENGVSRFILSVADPQTASTSVPAFPN
jgi:hypothetical protein